MSDKDKADTNHEQSFDQWSQNMTKLADQMREVANIYMNNPQSNSFFQANEIFANNDQKDFSGLNEKLTGMMGDMDPLNLAKTYQELSLAMMKNPQSLFTKQAELAHDYMNLWTQFGKRMMGEDATPVITPDADDKRFKADEWQENIVYDLIKQSYLLSAKAAHDLVTETEDLDEKTLKKAEFFTKQYIDALSPTNFALTNPDVMKATLDSKGDNLVKGMENLIHDLEKGKGQLKISMTDLDAFTLGKNIAITKGEVVFQNELIELIHYHPTTDEVNARPLLILPPWINKFYILDLGPKNSMIKWLVDQGHSVFCVSWVNPDETLSDFGFDEYIEKGAIAALDAVCEATDSQKINALGYCLGGTLLASTLAVLQSRGDERIASATYFTTMIDFSDPGDLGVFIEEEQLESLEAKMFERGYLDGREMAGVFNMLRANDLIWSFVINNYLKGNQPFPFDLLYWNSDSTRMPAKMHSYYLRKMYLENKLKDKNGLELCGVPIDLSQIKTPSFLLSTKEDHIAPWKSTYASTNIYKGPVKFVLAGSGHIAGVINPPREDKQKYGY